MTLQQLAQEVRDLSKEPLKVDPSQPQVTVNGEPIRSYLSKLADRIDELASSAYNRIDSEVCDRMNKEVAIEAAKIERIVRDAILSYEQLYKEAPNDDAELEIIQRCEVANDWLAAHGFARQAVSFNKEESPNL